MPGQAKTRRFPLHRCRFLPIAVKLYRATIFIVKRPSGDLSPDEYRSLAEFRRLIRRFLHFSEEQAQAKGLEPRQHQLLLAIKGLPDGASATIGELASRMQLRHHSTVELVNRLAARGFIERTAGEIDRREVLIKLTNSGEAILHELTIVHREELEVSGAELLRALRAVLKRSYPPAAKSRTRRSGRRTQAV